MVAWWHGGMVAWWHGGMVAWWHGGMVAWWHGGMVAWWHGGMVVGGFLVLGPVGVPVGAAVVGALVHFLLPPTIFQEQCAQQRK
jgi:hypothetical protein